VNEAEYSWHRVRHEFVTAIRGVYFAMPVDRREFDRAVNAALRGPEVRDVRFAEYRFNVKPVQIEREGDTIIVVGDEDNNGYISRRRRARANDRISYEFEKRGGIVDLEKIDIDINRGGVRRGLWRHRTEIYRTAKWLYEKWRELEDERRRREGAGGGSGPMFLTVEQQDELAEEMFEELKSTLDGSWESEAEFLISNIAMRVR